MGWCAISPTSSRCVYEGVAEVSIYIGEKYKCHGIGTALLTNLIKLSEENRFWTLYSAIIRENTGSIALHKKCGFREIGIREKVAKMNNKKWHDVVLMERRSKIVGIISFYLTKSNSSNYVSREFYKKLFTLDLNW